MKSRIAAVVGIAALLLTVGVLGFKKDDREYKISKNMDIFFSVYKELQTFYVDEPDPDELIPVAIDEMLSTLDPYTTYIPEKEKEAYNFQINGEYGGVGSVIQLCPDTDLIQVKEVYKGTPSAKVGLRAGDRFLTIDGESMRGKNVSEVSGKLRGKAGDKLEVEIERPGVTKPMQVEITREVIKIDAVDYYGMLDKETGYISLRGFETDCAEAVKEAFLELRDKRGAKRMILDLRSNPGGLLNEALDIVNLFVAKNSRTLSTHGRQRSMDRTYYATSDPIDTVMPLAVMINRGSASASEIVSGALQDLDRAVIVGQRSFGKGLVQATREVAHDGLLKVTTSKYYTPSGRCIQAIDYSHKSSKGDVTLIPDSLIQEFKTRHGRTVFDGGGISPDVVLEGKNYAPVTYSIVANDYAFRYVLNLQLNGKTLSTDAEGHMTDAGFDDFISYMKTQKKFTYKNRTLDACNAMIAMAKKEGQYEANAEQLEKMAEQLKPDLERDARAAADEIKQQIEVESVRMREYKRAAIGHSLQYDDQIKGAVELLKDEQRCKGLLDGSVASHAGDKRAAKEVQKNTEEDQ